ncbi:MAG: fumarylacetoacetate hydrolase family protein [Burkholderiales bacterium]|nr:fumarylacetoacetate hydrolase family protein [Burkholderiales bacterium]
MARWIRFERSGTAGFGQLDGETVRVHSGDMLGANAPTGETVPLSAVRLLTPTTPTKMLALWNNFHALAAKLNLATPAEPLYFLKSPNSFLPGGATIRRPAAYDGKVVFEGELGIVIGKTCRAVGVEEARRNIFGYTCINDVTAADLINRDPTFAQWTRAKSFDTFGVFGPAVATGLDPSTLTVRTVLNGQERQHYPVSDMVFGPSELVSLVSRDITIEPGDVICCGTSIGVGSMKPGSTIEITIDGIGTLANRYE